MPAKPSVNKCDDHNSMVNRHIGTAYDNVRIVAEHIAEVINVSEGIEPISLYLGAFSNPPTEGWNNEPLQSGNFYLNTTTNTVDYYDASEMIWISVDEETVVQSAQAAVAARDAAILAQTAAELAETNAESSAAAALQSEQNAALAEANSQASANASASSASDSATSASEALTSKNAAKASETASAQSESNAATSETNAANSASAAATSESNAGSFEAAASNSAVVAAGYAADAEAAFDNFTDLYLGAKASDPTTDNDGNPLQVGATYWNSTSNDLRYWSGATWDIPEQTAIQAANDAIAARDDAQLSETNASASEAAAAQSETNAAQSAANASISETNAAASAASALNSKSDIDILLENAGYKGLWPDTGGSALKGETYQTQIGGEPTGEYYTALKNTSVDPINDNDNWREVVNPESVTTAQNNIVGGSIFKGSNGDYVQNGDNVPAGTTHLLVSTGDESTIVAMSPVASGVVSSLTETGATIGVISVDFTSSNSYEFKTIEQMKSFPYLWVGQSVYIEERASRYKVIPATTNNDVTVLDATSSGLSLQIELDSPVLKHKQIGFDGIDDTDKLIIARDYLASLQDGGFIDFFGSTLNLVSSETANSMFNMKSKVVLWGGVNAWPNGDGGGRIILNPVTTKLFGINASTSDDLATEALTPLRATGLIGCSIDGSDKVQITLNTSYATDNSKFTDIFVINSLDHGVLIHKEWFAQFKGITARGNNGAGITIGGHPDITHGGDTAVNGIAFIDLEGHTNGLDDAYRIDTNEATGYGVGLFGTVHACSFNGVGVERNYGSGWYESLEFGSYTILGGFYAENNNKDGTDSNDYGILISEQTSISSNVVNWRGITLRNGQKLRAKPTATRYNIELLGDGGKPELDSGSNVVFDGSTRPIYYNNGASGVDERKLRVVSSAQEDLISWSGKRPIQIPVPNSGRYYLFIIPDSTTASGDSFSTRIDINGVSGSSFSITGPFTAYEPVLIANFTASARDVIEVVGTNSYNESVNVFVTLYQGVYSVEG